MEFKGQYLTYEDYKSLGGTLGKMPFNILELKARQVINERTQNRLKNVEETPGEVKVCMYQLIETMETYQNKVKNTAVASENIDGYSVSYKSGVDVTKEQRTQYEDIMTSLLYGVIVNSENILYLGTDNTYKEVLSTC